MDNFGSKLHSVLPALLTDVLNLWILGKKLMFFYRASEELMKEVAFQWLYIYIIS